MKQHYPWVALPLAMLFIALLCISISYVFWWHLLSAIDRQPAPSVWILNQSSSFFQKNKLLSKEKYENTKIFSLELFLIVRDMALKEG